MSEPNPAIPETTPPVPQPAAAPAEPVAVAATSAPAAPPPPAPQGGPNRNPPRPGNRGEPRDPRRFPRGDRPKVDGTKPPDLAPGDFAMMRPKKYDLDKDIESEMAAALAGFDVTSTVAQDEAKPRQQAVIPGQSAKKKGTVVGIHGKDVFVEVPGGRSQGVLPIQQFEGKPPAIGSTVEFDVEGYDGANGLLRLTMSGAAQVVTDWSSIARGMVVEAKVTGINKNKTGLLIEVNGIKGFMPVSQVDIHRTENIEALINQRLKCEIIEIDPAERNLVVSRRALLERERMRLADQFWSTVEIGQVKTGIIRSVKPFGAFVDLGAVDGLIPISELSWSRVGDPNEIVKLGQSVEVVIHRVDPDARKVTLSLRKTVRSPWDDFAEQCKPGARIMGKVTRLADFGAFVEVAPGVEGLIHVSELSTQRVRRVRDIVEEGQAVEVEVLNIDLDQRRIALSLKSLKAAQEADEDAAAEAEEEADLAALEERMATRTVNPNLRGGI